MLSFRHTHSHPHSTIDTFSNSVCEKYENFSLHFLSMEKSESHSIKSKQDDTNKTSFGALGPILLMENLVCTWLACVTFLVLHIDKVLIETNKKFHFHSKIIRKKGEAIETRRYSSVDRSTHRPSVLPFDFVTSIGFSNR